MSKGTEIERKAMKVLEKMGYTVHRTIRSSYRGLSNDIFGAFDLIATKYGRRLLFVQVTTRSNVSSHKPKCEAVPLDPAHARVEIWGWRGGRRKLDKRSKSKNWMDNQTFNRYILDLSSLYKLKCYQNNPNLTEDDWSFLLSCLWIKSDDLIDYNGIIKDDWLNEKTKEFYQNGQI